MLVVLLASLVQKRLQVLGHALPRRAFKIVLSEHLWLPEMQKPAVAGVGCIYCDRSANAFLNSAASSALPVSFG